MQFSSLLIASPKNIITQCSGTFRFLMTSKGSILALEIESNSKIGKSFFIINAPQGSLPREQEPHFI